eukprot:12735607-Alexandrium_andersonii.AAC.1
MVDSPRGQGQTPSAKAYWGPLRAAPTRAPYRGRERSDRVTWGAASRRPKLLCKSIFAQIASP